VNQSGGYIWVYSEPGRGTTFKVYLPRCDENLTEKPQTVKAALPRGTETILVVEDAAGVRMFISEVLKSNGYTVLATGEVDHAVALCEEHRRTNHLLLTDVVLPKIGGPAARRGADRPEIRSQGPVHVGLHRQRHRASPSAGAGHGVP